MMSDTLPAYLAEERTVPMKAIPVGMVAKDGYVVDPSTGEVIGHLEVREQFTPDTLDRAEFVLELMATADADLVALRARRAAIVKNMDAQIAAAQRRRDWLDSRFLAPLRTLTERLLEGGKRRSLTTAFAVMKLTHSAGRLEVVDPERALAWAEVYCPGAVQVKRSVLVSRVKAEGCTDPLGPPPNAFRVTPPAMCFKVETGVTGVAKEADDE